MPTSESGKEESPQAQSEDAGGRRNSGARLERASAVVGAVLLILAGGIGLAADAPVWGGVGPARGAMVLPLAVLLGGIALGVGAMTTAVRASAWFALALAGQAAALQMIEAGPVVRYQHYLPAWRLVSVAPVALGITVGQAVILFLFGRQSLKRAGRWLVDEFGTSRVILLGLVVLLTSATLSRDPMVYGAELAFAATIQLLGLGTVVLAAMALPQPVAVAIDLRGRRLFGGRTEGTGRRDPFPWWLAGWVLVVATGLGAFVYQWHPHIPDELPYLLHARYFADGRLFLPAPPVPGAFEVDLLQYDPSKWYSPVPLGWPAVLAVGALLELPGLVNPILAGLCVVLTYRLLAEVYDLGIARLGTILLAVSPWFLFMAMNFMTHTATLAFGLAAALAVAMLRRTRRLRWALLGGAAIGWVSLIRPLEGLVLAGLLGIWALPVPGRTTRFAPVVCLALATAAVAAVTLPYNAALTGSALEFPLMRYTDLQYGEGANAMGFGPDRGLGWPGLDPLPGHGFLDVLINANLNVYSINTELLGWVTGSVGIIALLMVAWDRLRRADLLMLAAVVAVAGAHSFYWFSGGPDFGARYWYLASVPLIALAARDIDVLRAKMPHGTARGRMLAGIGGLCLMTLTVFMPWRSLDKYYHYRGMRPDIRTIAEQRDLGRSLVLIRGRRHPDYASAVIYNPLDLEADAPIYAWHRDSELTRRLLEHYRDRPVWIIDGPSVTGDGYQVATGPLDASLLLAAPELPSTDGLQ